MPSLDQPSNAGASTPLYDALAVLVPVAVGLAIWIPAVAMEPRHTRGEQGQDWYWLSMIAAAVILGAVFRRYWAVIGVALVAPQLLLAPFTAPRGDGDGLWVLIFPFLAVFGVVLHAIAKASASATEFVIRRVGHD